MADGAGHRYSCRIAKAGAFLADTKVLLSNWSDSLSVAENLAAFQRDNVLGKASRSRLDVLLPVFRRRYLSDPSVLRALVTLVKRQFPATALERVLYFHTALATPLLHDVVVDVLLPWYEQGVREIALERLKGVIAEWVAQGRTAGSWTDYTTHRVAQGVLSTLRDFGVLEGSVNKHLTTPYLPVEAFAYIAFFLKRDQPSGERLVNDPEWRLFFLSREAVERLFMEAHQRRLLEYYAAGSIVRIDFPAESIEEYARVVAERPH